jgi:hypothetical protein
VVDGASKSSQKLKAALHSFQVQNELLHYENNGLRAALTVKKKHCKKNRPLDLQQRKEYHGGAVFWSPRKVKEAEARQVVKQREAESQIFYKTQQKELKAAAALYKKQQLEEARKAREIDKERKKQEQKAKAERLVMTRLEKQHQKDAANTQKALQLSQRGKRPASQKAASKPKRARTDISAVDGAEAAEAAPKLTSRGRPINPPRKFE